MSSGAKLKLKSVQKHIKASEWQDAIELAQEIVKEEKGTGQNVYNALVFAGLALTKIENWEQAEKAYAQAIKLSPSLPLAYQGLSSLYSTRQEWDKLCSLFESQVIRSVEEQQVEETGKHLQKLLELRKEHGPEEKLDECLALLLPGSKLSDLLQGLTPVGAAEGGLEQSKTDKATAYVPWSIPSLPSPPTYHDLPLTSALPPHSPSSTLPSYPSPLPTIAQIIHTPETNLALMITLTIRRENIERVNEEKEVEKRRKRLGAGGEKEVRRTVGREFGNESKLPEYYNEILSHPNAQEEDRRAAESNLFRYWYRMMYCLSRNASETPAVQTKQLDFPGNLFASAQASPLPLKAVARGKVEDMAKGMVLLQVEDEAGWNVELEWNDVGGLDQYELSFLHAYITLFPLSPTSTLISGYLRQFSRPLPGDEDRKKAARMRRRELQKRAKKGKKVVDDRIDADEVEREEEDENARREPFTVLVNALELLPKSLFAHKVLAEAYLREEDWANTIATAEKGKDIIRAMEIDTGEKMPASRAVLDVLLGTALVHFFPPKHHPRAFQLLDGVLKLDPTAIPCLMGRAQIFQSEHQYEKAYNEFQTIIDLESKGRTEDMAISQPELQAREEAGWCQIKQGDLEKGKLMINEVVEVLQKTEAKDLDLARCLWRIGVADWELGVEHRDQAHENWVAALRHHPTFASAFTSIGIWYLEHATPADPERASKCFQKAFELDATQADAARRLAEGCASETEWALVDVVAKRVMAGEGGIDGGLSGKESGSTQQKFLPTNAWAWKAAGAVQMAYKKYNEAAQSFQVALRAEEDDVHLWTRLGEAYAKSGRHVAALKALRKALHLDPEQWICYYHIGNVQRELGLSDEAIAAYKQAILAKPDEAGVIVALSEAYLAQGRQAQESGLRQRAFQAYLSCLSEIGKSLASKHRLTAWRIFGDACVQVYGCIRDGDQVQEAQRQILPNLEYLAGLGESKAASVTGVVDLKLLLGATWHSTDILKSGIATLAYRSDLLKFDTRVPEPPLYDLASALHIFAVATTNKDESASATRAAVLAIKKALESDPASPSLWSAFGTVAARGSKQLAQHAYVVALDLEPRNAITWCNFGFLCIEAQDLDLAGKALEKAQILEPDNALAWTGLALVAHAEFQPKRAEAFFDQAVTLSGGSELSSSLGLANLAFQPFLRSSAFDSVSLHGPAFALKRYCEDKPNDSSALVLLSLVLERLNQYPAAIEAIQKGVTNLETEYEQSESTDVADKYAVALANLARIELANQNPTRALELFGDCLGLLSESSDERSILTRVQCRLGSALALTASGDLDQALEKFQEALDDTSGLGKSIGMVKETIAVYLAKGLWSLGDEDAREMAKTQLLESLSETEHAARALATTATVGILTEDDGVIEAVSSEVDETKPEERLAEDAVLNRFSAMYAICKGDLKKARDLMEESIQHNPSSAKAWTSIGELLGSSGISPENPESTFDAAKLRLKLIEAGAAAGVTIIDSTRDESVEKKSLAEENKIEAVEKPMEENREEALKNAQKAVMMEPWEHKHWESLAGLTL